MTGTEPYTGQDGLKSRGTYTSTIFGTRIATPFSGSGFNVCIGAPAALRRPAPLTLLGKVFWQQTTSPIAVHSQAEQPAQRSASASGLHIPTLVKVLAPRGTSYAPP